MYRDQAGKRPTGLISIRPDKSGLLNQRNTLLSSKIKGPLKTSHQLGFPALEPLGHAFQFKAQRGSTLGVAALIRLLR